MPIHFTKLSPILASVELDGVSLNFILHTHPGQVTFWFIIKKNPNYKTLMEDNIKWETNSMEDNLNGS